MARRSKMRSAAATTPPPSQTATPPSHLATRAREDGNREGSIASTPALAPEQPQAASRTDAPSLPPLPSPSPALNNEPAHAGSEMGSQQPASTGPIRSQRQKQRRPTQAGPRAAGAGVHLGEAAYQARRQEISEQFGKSQKSLETYRRYANQARLWLHTAEHPVSYADGLDVLGENSEKVCVQYLTHCFDKYRAATMRGIVSGLGWYFTTAHGCSPNNRHGWHKTGGTWYGNPIFSEEVQTLLKVKKREEVKDRPIAKQATAMLYPDLAKILKGIHEQLEPYKENGTVLSGKRTQLELMHCYSILAYRLWTRCEELCQLTWSAINPEAQVNDQGDEYLQVTLTFRKTNQLDPTKGHTYQLFPLDKRPAVNALTAVPRWRSYWAWVVGRQPVSTDLVFPNIYLKTGDFRMEEKMSSNEINAMLAMFSEFPGLTLPPGEKFSSHCFRRGGLRDAVIHAHRYGEERKSFLAAQWWGGWSDSDQNDTILKYLVDDIRKGESYHGDMEDRNNPDNRMRYLAGGMRNEMAHVLGGFQQQFFTFAQHIDHKLGALSRLVQAPVPQRPFQLQVALPPFHPHHPGGPMPTVYHASGLCPSDGSTIYANPTPQSATYSPTAPGTTHRPAPETSPRLPRAQPVPTSSAPPLQVSGTPMIGEDGQASRPLPQRIPPAFTMEDVVRQWEQGEPSKGLRLPLGQWTSAMRKKEKGGNAQVYSLRKKLYTAYLDRSRSFEAFYQFYGEGQSLRDYLRLIKERAVPNA